jgi:hypothetical protein
MQLAAAILSVNDQRTRGAHVDPGNLAAPARGTRRERHRQQ